MKLSAYLEKKFGKADFVITSCKEDLDVYNAFGGIFGDIFK
jgi:hypothetical protein